MHTHIHINSNSNWSHDEDTLETGWQKRKRSTTSVTIWEDLTEEVAPELSLKEG